jgi:hypothetical protein
MVMIMAFPILSWNRVMFIIVSIQLIFAMYVILMINVLRVPVVRIKIKFMAVEDGAVLPIQEPVVKSISTFSS